MNLFLSLCQIEKRSLDRSMQMSMDVGAQIVKLVVMKSAQCKSSGELKRRLEQRM